MQLARTARWTPAAILILAAGCSDQPTSPAPDALAPQHSAASADGLPERISNAVKYRDSGIKPATGRAGSATLTVRALLGKDGVTDLEMTTGELDGTAAAPGNLAKLQIKAFDPQDSLQYTKNFTNLKQGGYIAQQYPDRPRHGKIQVQANIDGIDRKRTGVVTVTETVKLRPDLVTAALAVPAQARVSTPVNIGATVSELNGDAGATASCVLYVDGAEADRADGIWVDAGGTVSCAFTQIFPTTGTRQLEVRAEGVVPGDYDSANNSVSASLEITSANDFSYNAQASDRTFENNWLDNGFWQDTDHRRDWQNAGYDFGRTQDAHMWGQMPRQVSFPLTRVTTAHATDGETILTKQYEDLEAQWTYSWGDADFGSDYRCVSLGDMDDGHWVNWIQVCSGESRYNGVVSPWTNINSHRYAGDVTYHSSGFDIHWYRATGEVAYSYTSNYDSRPIWGELVEYGEDYQIEFELQADGQQYTTSPLIPLQRFDISWDNRANPARTWDSWGDYSYEYFQRRWGFNRGITGSISGNPGS